MAAHDVWQNGIGHMMEFGVRRAWGQRLSAMCTHPRVRCLSSVLSRFTHTATSSGEPNPLAPLSAVESNGSRVSNAEASSPSGRYAFARSRRLGGSGGAIARPSPTHAHATTCNSY
jgi:hypothetical protein